jgi:nucleoside-diphosphate-sugar epimerase
MPVRSIVTTGAGPLAARAIALLRREPATTVLAVPDPSDLVVDGADTLVHLDGDVDGTRRVLGALNSTVSAVVLLSSATVYGAWPDNPVPLTEDAPLRPNPGVPDAARHAEAERVLGVWAADHPGASVTILRPATMVGPGVDSWLAEALGGRGLVRPDRADPVGQFVHVDDVATAVALAARDRLDGVYNVAPNGSVPGEVVRKLGAWRPSLAVPGWIARLAARWGWALGVSRVPPPVMALVEHPWVIASDRLQAAGWTPQYTSEEAIVAGRPASRWREMSAGRRQSAALAGVGVAAAGVVAAAAVAVSRARRRHRPPGVS